MNKLQRFEDIIASQKARALTKDVYAATKVGLFMKDYGLKDQIQRSSVSTMANIAEGFERGGDKEFIQFLSNSKGSCGEVRSHLYVAFDQEYIPQNIFDEFSRGFAWNSKCYSTEIRVGLCNLKTIEFLL